MNTALERLIHAWNSSGFQPGKWNVLERDSETLLSSAYKNRLYSNWNEWVNGHERGNDFGSDLHTSLLPMPYVGNLRRARVFLCTLNPGLSPQDYFGEHQVPEYQEALLSNLRQGSTTKFHFLEPKHCWHDGSAYWIPRLRGITQRVQQKLNVSTRDAFDICANSIAVLELVPYHSDRFELAEKAIQALESTRLIRDFVFQEVLPRHLEGDCKLIVLRSRKLWLYPQTDNSNFPQAKSPRNGYIEDCDAEDAAEIICNFSKI